MIYIWVGPTGYNSKLGYVQTGHKVRIPQEKLQDYIDQNLVKKKIKNATKTTQE